MHDILKLCISGGCLRNAVQFNGKTKFWFFTILLLTTRIGDGIATYIGTPDLSREANPLVYVFGLGWEALIIANVIGSALIVMLFYYSFVKYKSGIIQCDGFKQYISMLNYDRPDKFIWTFYKFPNKESLPVMLACIGYILAIVVPITSIILIIEWILIINNNELKLPYTISIPYIPRLDLVLLNLVLIIFSSYYWYYKEYKLNKKKLEENKINQVV